MDNEIVVKPKISGVKSLIKNIEVTNWMILLKKALISNQPILSKKKLNLITN